MKSVTVSEMLVVAVKRHAVEHYEDGGWDVVVECWSDKEIAEHIRGAKTVAEAIKKFATVVSVWAERQADAAHHRREAVGDESPAVSAGPHTLLVEGRCSPCSCCGYGVRDGERCWCV